MKEKSAFMLNGFIFLLLDILLLAASVYFFVGMNILLGVITVILFCIIASGIKIVAPNQSLVLTFFGKYIGCINKSGIRFNVPFSVGKKVSLRVKNFNCEKLKVNDVNGNPIEIAAVVVFKVTEPAKAVFDVDDYESFVQIQSETALRHVAAKYPYDNFVDTGLSLRGHTVEIAEELSRELQERLSVAGVEIMETRLTHLAYATEIANAMLQRQQADAILAARQKIVEGAVSMAQMAIEQLEANHTLELDDERKMAMINNLLVAIVSDRSAQPVINTGTLY
ncbi:MAG: SPFH domain-containing protein [Clostridia bacterium]|nr:SPFH domain-containing protein [Clostridia bacterium]MDD4571700.1 SPFH domain-containing protein [Clostridia bacterium]